MKNYPRKEVRYDNIGRIDSPEMSPMPGVLDDISASGCRVHFPVPLTLDSDVDFPVKLTVTSITPHIVLELKGRACWTYIHDTQTDVGIEFSTGINTPELLNYIRTLEDNAEKERASDFDNLIVDQDVSYI